MRLPILAWLLTAAMAGSLGGVRHSFTMTGGAGLARRSCSKQEINVRKIVEIDAGDSTSSIGCLSETTSMRSFGEKVSASGLSAHIARFDL